MVHRTPPTPPAAPESVGSHEVYELAFAPGARLLSEAHSPGCREHLTVLEGRLAVSELLAGRIFIDGASSDEASAPPVNSANVAAMQRRVWCVFITAPKTSSVRR